MHSNPAKLLKDSTIEPIAYLFNLSNIPKSDNGKLMILILTLVKVQKAYKLSSDNILSQLPLWVANCYEYADYERRIMKTADKELEYLNDKQFLYKCFLWAGISQINKCLSKDGLLNNFCFRQNTIADCILSNYTISGDDKVLFNQWQVVLSEAKDTDEYNSNWKYGLSQIDKDLNIKIGSGTLNKKGEEIMVPKYKVLDEKISILKEILRKYYTKELKPKLFKYELLK